MGLTDRLAKAIAAQIAKGLPPGSVTMSEKDMIQSANNQTNTYGAQSPLPRNPLMSSIPFGPGSPIFPGAINPIGSSGRAEPRRYEYQVAQNLNVGTEQKLVDFKTLRGAAEQIDIVRRCIEVLKSKVSGIDWDITIAEDASEKIIAEIGGDHVRAMGQAREKFSSEIYRVRSFWENPDKANGLTFIDWIMIALEEILVLDAWAIWPQKTVGGDIYGLQILDGSTIKPLLDDRGMRPATPNPAFQQVLYGFPRTEFTAPDENSDGEFTSDELTYLIRNRRAFSAYGNSPVERCLPVADLYLRRQQWLRAEYTDGVLPDLMFTVDADFGNDPRLLRELENAFNDDLAGQTEQRHRARILPSGFNPVTLEGYGEKFKEVLDTYLVTSICGHFGVMPTEIGFSQKGGLGASGHQQGEQQSAQQIGVGPLVYWLSRMLTNLSYQYLGMPRELEFKFMVEEGKDSEKEALRADLEMRGGTRTINERRSELGLPLLDNPAADQPMLVAGTSVFIFTPDGIINMSTATGEPPSIDQMNPDTNPIAPTKDKPAPVAPVIPIDGKPKPDAIAPPTAKPVSKMEEIVKYSEDQERAENGQFGSGSGSSGQSKNEKAIRNLLPKLDKQRLALERIGQHESAAHVQNAKQSLENRISPSSRGLADINDATRSMISASQSTSMGAGEILTLAGSFDKLKSAEKMGVPSMDAVETALSQLITVPNMGGENGDNADDKAKDNLIDSPWSYVDAPIVVPEVWDKAELTLVQVKDLIGTNVGLDRDNVEEHIKSMGQALTEYRSYPLVLQSGDDQIIIDGHHRLFAMWLLGMDTVPVWLGAPDTSKAASDEVRAFLKWSSKGKRARKFEFKSLDAIVGEALNRCYFDDDKETMRSLAKAYLA
jgi:hypothetical protein